MRYPAFNSWKIILDLTGPHARHHQTRHCMCVREREREEGKVSSCFIQSELILITMASGVMLCHFLLSSAPSQSCHSSIAKMKPRKYRAGRSVNIKTKPIVHNQDSVHVFNSYTWDGRVCLQFSPVGSRMGGGGSFLCWRWREGVTDVI